MILETKRGPETPEEEQTTAPGTLPEYHTLQPGVPQNYYPGHLGTYNCQHVHEQQQRELEQQEADAVIENHRLEQERQAQVEWQCQQLTTAEKQYLEDTGYATTTEGHDVTADNTQPTHTSTPTGKEFPQLDKEEEVTQFLAQQLHRTALSDDGHDRCPPGKLTSSDSNLNLGEKEKARPKIAVKNVTKGKSTIVNKKIIKKPTGPVKPKPSSGASKLADELFSTKTKINPALLATERVTRGNPEARTVRNLALPRTAPEYKK